MVGTTIVRKGRCSVLPFSALIHAGRHFSHDGMRLLSMGNPYGAVMHALLLTPIPLGAVRFVMAAPDVHSGPGLYMSASACVTLLTVLVVAPLLPAILAPPLVHKAGQGGEGVATPVAVAAAPTA
jgi:hypothetical protein